MHCRRRYPSANARGEFGQPFSVAVRRFAVGDIENRRRVTFAVIRTATSPGPVRTHAAAAYIGVCPSATARSTLAVRPPKRASPVGKPPLPLHLLARSVAFIQFRRFDDQTLSLWTVMARPARRDTPAPQCRNSRVTLFASAAMQQSPRSILTVAATASALKPYGRTARSALPSSRTGRSK